MFLLVLTVVMRFSILSVFMPVGAGILSSVANLLGSHQPANFGFLLEGEMEGGALKAALAGGVETAEAMVQGNGVRFTYTDTEKFLKAWRVVFDVPFNASPNPSLPPPLSWWAREQGVVTGVLEGDFSDFDRQKQEKQNFKPMTLMVLMEDGADLDAALAVLRERFPEAAGIRALRAVGQIHIKFRQPMQVLSAWRAFTGNSASSFPGEGRDNEVDPMFKELGVKFVEVDAPVEALKTAEL